MWQQRRQPLQPANGAFFFFLSCTSFSHNIVRCVRLCLFIIIWSHQIDIVNSNCSFNFFPSRLQWRFMMKLFDGDDSWWCNKKQSPLSVLFLADVQLGSSQEPCKRSSVWSNVSASVAEKQFVFCLYLRNATAQLSMWPRHNNDFQPESTMAYSWEHLLYILHAMALAYMMYFKIHLSYGMVVGCDCVCLYALRTGNRTTLSWSRRELCQLCRPFT